MLPFLLKFTSKLYDFPSNNSQFECQFLQLDEHCKGFLLGKIAFQSDHSLIIIHPDTAKLSVQSRQFLVVIEQRTIHFYHPKGLIKDPCLDEKRLTSHTTFLFHREEMSVFRRHEIDRNALFCLLFGASTPNFLHFFLLCILVFHDITGI